jgi:hypothetical protein
VAQNYGPYTKLSLDDFGVAGSAKKQSYQKYMVDCFFFGVGYSTFILLHLLKLKAKNRRIIMNSRFLRSWTLLSTLSISLLSVSAYGAPTITSLNNTNPSHGQSINIAGTGFGGKSNAAPLVWDDCSATLITSKWSGGWPSGGDSTRVIKYQTPIRGVALPHSHITKYMTGGFSSTDYNTGYNVGVWRTFTNMSYPVTIYASWYRQMDPQWNTSWSSTCDGSDNNFKIFDVSNGSSPFTMNGASDGNWYMDYSQSSCGGNTRINWTNPSWEMNDDGWGVLSSEQYFGASGYNPIGKWIKTEVEIKLTDQSNGYAKAWDNGVQTVNYTGKTIGWSGTTKSIGPMSYARLKDTNSWLYFADLYLDTTAQRALICTGSTWSTRGVCEVQIPTAWGDTSATVNVNQGAFANGSNAYLYVVDGTGAASNGQKVTFGTSGGTSIPAPTVTATYSP